MKYLHIAQAYEAHNKAQEKAQEQARNTEPMQQMNEAFDKQRDRNNRTRVMSYIPVIRLDLN